MLACGALTSANGVGAETCGVEHNHATVVIEHGNGRTLKYCIGFSGATISGRSLLAATGLELDAPTTTVGAEVCQIDDEPAVVPANCFGSGAYWAEFITNGSCAATPGATWRYAGCGLGSASFQSGSALGLRYENGTAPPPSPAGVCPTAASAAGATSKQRAVRIIASAGTPFSAKRSASPTIGFVVACLAIVVIAGSLALTLIRRRNTA